MWHLLLVAQFALPVSQFAQADNRAALQRVSLTAARRYEPLRAAHDDVQIPPNLIVARVYEQTVASMRALSVTFREQCMRIANAKHVTIVLGVDASHTAHSVRAFTRMTRESNGDLRAVVRIRQTEHAPELIAHELEHIIEQLDGVDLDAMATMTASGVRRCQCGDTDTFETQRAVSIGEQVAREVADHDR